MRVLIVEDDSDLRIVLHESLTEAGFEVADCKTGEEALALEPIFQPDICLIDFSLPGIDGRDAAAILRRQRKSAVLIGMTGWTLERASRTCFGIFDRMVAKPFSLDGLIMLLYEMAPRTRERLTDQDSEDFDAVDTADLTG